MPSNTNRKVFDKLVSKTKIYLVIIAILLIILCIYEINFIMPAILTYVLILMYAYWTNNKRKMELSEEEYTKLTENEKRLYRRRQTKDGNKILYKMRFLSFILSIRAPENSENSIIGTNCAALTKPTSKGSFVIMSASHG